MRATFFAFDTETTGLDPATCEIVSIAILLLDGQLNELNRLVIYANPVNGCPPEAASVNSYSPERWAERGAVSQEECFTRVEAFVKSYERLIPLGHNVKYDLEVLRALFKRHGGDATFEKAFAYHTVDTITASVLVELVKNGTVDGTRKLEILCERYGIPIEGAHDSLVDIAATVELLRLFCRVLRNSEEAIPGPIRKPMVVMTDGEYVFNTGKHAGVKVASAPKDYLQWVLRKVTDLTPEQKAYVAQCYSST